MTVYREGRCKSAEVRVLRDALVDLPRGRLRPGMAERDTVMRVLRNTANERPGNRGLGGDTGLWCGCQWNGKETDKKNGTGMEVTP